MVLFYIIVTGRLQLNQMLKNYFKIAFRSLWRHRVFSIINIMGLAVGMTACFLIFLYVRFETSYDNFHSKADRIYRVVRRSENAIGNHQTGRDHFAGCYLYEERLSGSGRGRSFGTGIASWFVKEILNSRKIIPCWQILTSLQFLIFP